MGRYEPGAIGAELMNRDLRLALRDQDDRSNRRDHRVAGELRTAVVALGRRTEDLDQHGRIEHGLFRSISRIDLERTAYDGYVGVRRAVGFDRPHLEIRFEHTTRLTAELGTQDPADVVTN